MTGRIETRMEEREGGLVASVVIDNRDKLNALNSALMQEFVAAIEACAANPAVRMVLLSGAGGKAFVGGADIVEMAGLDPAGARAFITRVHQCCHAVRACPLPVVALVDGHCYGAGLELAASCDFRIATDRSSFGMQEVRLGIPSVVEAAVLPQLIGWGRTRDILLTGEIFGADRAEKWGLIERLVTPDKLGVETEAVVQALLASGPNALRLQKRLITQWETLPLPAAINAGIDAFEEAFGSDEAQRMLGHFVAARNKRKGLA